MAQVDTCPMLYEFEDNGICAMPVEVWYWIISFLEAKDMLLISALSKSLKHLPDDDVLWKRLCAKKLGLTGPLPPTLSLWREFYAKHKCYVGYWDVNSMGKMLLSRDKLSAAHGGDFLGSYQCVRGSLPITQGVCFWEVKIDKLSMHQTGFHVVVGLIPPSFNSFNSYLTSNGGMGYLADGRKAFNSGNGEHYNQKFQEGDTVGVLVDLIAGTVTFYKNGVSQGIAFRNISGPLYPAVSLLTGGQQVTLNNNSIFPQMN